VGGTEKEEGAMPVQHVMHSLAVSRTQKASPVCTREFSPEKA
jgi:hypothetical protein